MIQVSEITKRYVSGVTAVDNLSFSVERGHIYGLLGLNGAGKTTTLNILTGAIAATHGQVTVCGYDLLTQSQAAKACIGYLPEHPPLYPDLTPDEYLHFVGSAKGIARCDLSLAVKKALNATGTYSVRNKLISSLSKGYRQRLGIAQALLGNPPILILDEPTVGLDPTQVIELRKLILSLGKEHTVILSSHILSEVSEVCDRILILHEGRLLANDTPEGLQKLCPDSSLIEMTVAVNSSTAKEILAKVPGITRAEYEDENRFCHIRLSPSPGKDPREALFFAFAGAHRAILSMTRREWTLEDIFIRIIRTSPTPVQKSKSKPSNAHPIQKKPDLSESKKRLKPSFLTDTSPDSNPKVNQNTDESDDVDYRPLFGFKFGK